MSFPITFPEEFGETPVSLVDTGQPADTDKYIYRPVLRLVNGEFVTQYMQIWITQP